MSFLNCCCGEYPKGAKCYSLEFTPKFLQYASTTIDVGTCTIDKGEPCTEEAGFDITVTVARGAWEEVTSKPVLSALAGPLFCSCGTACVYTWPAPDPNTWTAAVEWCSSDCSEGTAEGSGGSAYRLVSGTNLQFLTFSSPAYCEPGLGAVVITFRAAPPDVTLTGDCEDITIETAFGAVYPMTSTTIELVYCFRAGTAKCVLDLYSVTVNAVLQTFGGAPSDPDCYCNGTGPVVTYTGTAASGTEIVGSFGTIYALAGSPPTEITCRECVP